MGIKDVLVVIKSGDSGYIAGDSDPEGPEYPGIYPEFPDSGNCNPRFQKSKDLTMEFE